MTAPTKTTESVGRKVPINRKVPGASIGAEKKVEMKHFAIVFKIKCGTWYSRHYHHQVNVIEVPADFAVSKIRDSARKASEIMSQIGGKKVSVLTVKEVQIASQAVMRSVGEKMLSEILK